MQQMSVVVVKIMIWPELLDGTELVVRAGYWVSGLFPPSCLDIAILHL